MPQHGEPAQLVKLDSQPSSTVGAAGKLQLPWPDWQAELQVPPEHVSVEVYDELQARPHEPQLAVLVFRFDSQPSSGVGEAGWTQLPNPPTHVGLQLPAVHEVDCALATEQARAHAPQLFTLVFTLVSQPSSAAGATGLLQLPKPELHDDEQTPAEQATALTLTSEQTLPHPPQLAASTVRAVSHPLSASGAAGVVQLPNPALQLDTHRPAAQESDAAFEPEQGRPQAPQLAVLVDRSDSQPSSRAGAAGWLQLP